MPEVLRRALVDRRRTLISWSIGTALYIAMIAAVFPSVKDSPGFQNLAQNYPEVLKHLFGISGTLGITTGPGFLDAELFSAMLPLFVLVLAIGTGAGTLAGEHEQGSLELIISAPVSRRSIVLWKAAGLAIELGVLAVAATAALLVADPLAGLSLDPGRVVGAVAGLGLLGLFHGSMALAVGAATRHRASAIGVPAAVGAVGYLVAGLAGLASWLSPFRYLSPFHYSGQAPLQTGADGWGLLVLAAGAAVSVVAAVLTFERRDLGAA